jgi:hypothetical protein
MRAEQADQATVGERPRVNFARMIYGCEDPIPKRAEGRAVAPFSQAIRAFPAHARRCRRVAHVALAREGIGKRSWRSAVQPSRRVLGE